MGCNYVKCSKLGVVCLVSRAASVVAFDGEELLKYVKVEQAWGKSLIFEYNLKPIGMLEKLRKPLKNRWRVLQHKDRGGKDKVIMAAYVDSRDVQNALDNAVGVGNWCDEYYSVGDHTYCRIGINIDDQWVFKSDAGAPTKISSEKGLASDAFKRAAVKWGINRDAYEFEQMELDAKKWGKNWFPVNPKGEVLMGQVLYDYCNKRAKVSEAPEVEAEKKEPLSDKRFESAIAALRKGSTTKEVIMNFALTSAQQIALENE